MDISARIAVLSITLTALCGCTLPLVMRTDRYEICSIGVSENFGAIGAIAGLSVGTPPAAMETILGVIGNVGLRAAFVFPPAALAVIPALVAGAAKAESVRDAATAVSTAVADADVHRLAEALSAAAATTIRSSACRARATTDEEGKPDATVEIDSLAIGLSQLSGNSTLYTEVRWRMIKGTDGRELAAATTTCKFASTIESADWLSASAQARTDIEKALAKTGEQIAAHLFTLKIGSACRSR